MSQQYTHIWGAQWCCWVNQYLRYPSTLLTSGHSRDAVESIIGRDVSAIYSHLGSAVMLLSQSVPQISKHSTHIRAQQGCCWVNHWQRCLSNILTSGERSDAVESISTSNIQGLYSHQGTAEMLLSQSRAVMYQQHSHIQGQKGFCWVNLLYTNGSTALDETALWSHLDRAEMFVGKIIVGMDQHSAIY